MNAKELRIGNFILSHSKREFKVLSVGDIKHGLCCESSDNKEIFYVTASPSVGIPLTEEWLRKLKFEGSEDEMHKVLGLGGGEELSVELLTKTCCLTRDAVGFPQNDGFKDFVYVKYPEYVHQLQNLWMSITGEELICE